MFRKARNIHISPAGILAGIALFVALGGVSYAAATIHGSTIENHTIGAKKFKRGAVNNVALRKASVSREKVRKRTLTGEQIRQDSLTGEEIDESTLGQVPSAQQADSATSAQTAASATSAQTAASVGPGGVNTAALQNGSVRGPKFGATTVRSQAVSVPAGQSAFISRGCLAGERLISGGAQWSATTTGLQLVHSYPVSTSIWGARGHNGTGTDRDLTVRVICLAG